jgi:hypothetical protein
MQRKPAPDQRIVHPHQLERRRVAEPRRHFGRADDVGHQHAAQSRIHVRPGVACGQAGIADSAEESLDRGEVDRDDVGRHPAMGLAVNVRCSRGIGRLHDG